MSPSFGGNVSKKMYRSVFRVVLTFFVTAILMTVMFSLSPRTATAATITVTAPSSIVLGTPMIVGANISASSSAGTVTTNATTWHVEVTSTNSGFMTNGIDNLTRRLKICPDSTFNNNNAQNANFVLIYPDNPTTLPFSASQIVEATDKSGSYSITLTFTGVIDS
jgi:hypothetical protein